MLLVKDFKIQLSSHRDKWEAKAWNTHAQFVVESDSHYYAVNKAVQSCLEYHVARYFESAFIALASTNEVVYKNLACLEFEQKIGGEIESVMDRHKTNAPINYSGQPVHLDIESELCHGFRVIRIAAVRFLSTAHQGS